MNFHLTLFLQSQVCRSVDNVAEGGSNIGQCSSIDSSQTTRGQFSQTPVYSFSRRPNSIISLPKISNDLLDYDDLPTDHKPVLPPKIGHQSSTHLMAIDPVQLALHKQIMSQSTGNLPSRKSSSANYHTLEGKKRTTEHPVQSSGENNLSEKLAINTPLPLPPKHIINRSKVTASLDVDASENYDEPTTKYQRTINSNDVGREFEDYDEPVIKHTIAARAEFEDYDEPINHSQSASKHKR